ncbi:MAG: TM7S3/TM198-like domain-containing protein [Planctomycetota bacterium]|jgi:hypothetical protein
MYEYMPFLRFNAAAYQSGTVVAVCAVMLVSGLLFLLYGYRTYRVVAVLATGLLGVYMGRHLLYPHLPENVAWLAPLGLGLLGAVGALAVQRAMVFLASAAVGFISLGPVVAETIWRGPEGPSPNHYLISGLAAFLVMGILSLVLFRAVVVVATSMFGSTLIVSSIVHLVETLSPAHQGLYQTNGRELAWTFAGVAIVGTVFQATAKKKKKDTKRK